MGCLASMPIFSRMIPFPWEAPLRGEDFQAVPRAPFKEMLVGPSVLSAVDSKLARCVETRGFSFTHVGDDVVW